MGEGRGRIVDGNPIVISILIFFIGKLQEGREWQKKWEKMWEGENRRVFEAHKQGGEIIVGFKEEGRDRFLKPDIWIYKRPEVSP